MKQAKEFDFITLPEKIEGTSCTNCSFVRPKGEGYICAHPELKGLEVNDRNCCALWDSGEAIRAWEEKGKHPWHDDSNYRSIEGSDLDKRDGLSEDEKALSWLGNMEAIVPPPAWGGPKPQKKKTGLEVKKKYGPTNEGEEAFSKPEQPKPKTVGQRMQGGPGASRIQPTPPPTAQQSPKPAPKQEYEPPTPFEAPLIDREINQTKPEEGEVDYFEGKLPLQWYKDKLAEHGWDPELDKAGDEAVRQWAKQQETEQDFGEPSYFSSVQDYVQHVTDKLLELAQDKGLTANQLGFLRGYAEELAWAKWEEYEDLESEEDEDEGPQFEDPDDLFGLHEGDYQPPATTEELDKLVREWVDFQARHADPDTVEEDRRQLGKLNSDYDPMQYVEDVMDGSYGEAVLDWIGPLNPYDKDHWRELFQGLDSYVGKVALAVYAVQRWQNMPEFMLADVVQAARRWAEAKWHEEMGKFGGGGYSGEEEPQ